MENKENMGDLHTLLEESRGAKRKEKERVEIEVHREKK